MSINISMLYEEHGLTAKRKTAGELCGPCPWCGGKDRFTLFTEQGAEGLGRFWCRQCGKSGDAIQFLRDLDGLTFHEAKAALGLAEQPRRHSRRETPERARPEFLPAALTPPGEVWQQRAAKIACWATAQLRATPAARQWLLDERGLTPDTALAAGLGWIPQDFYRPREAFGLPPECKENGKPRRVWIPQGLSIPVMARAGAILRVKFRVAQKDGQNRPKYIPLPQVEKCTAPLVLESRSGASAWQVVKRA